MRDKPGNLPPAAGRRRVAMVLDTVNPAGRQVMTGIAQCVHERGMDWEMHLELGTAEDAPGLRHWSGDGIIARVRSPRVGQALRSFDVPKLLDRPIAPVAGHRSPTVLFPWNTGDGDAVFAHFAERGFRHFAFCPVRQGENWWREERFTRAVKAGGREFQLHPPPVRSPGKRSAEFDAAVEAKWIAALPKPVGIYAYSDLQGYYLLEVCRAVGAAVPDEVAIIGPDNDEALCMLCSPHLSSLNMQHTQVGYQVAELLEKLMSGRTAAKADEPASPMPVEVIVRASTDTLAMADPEVKGAMTYIRDHVGDRIGVSDLVEHGNVSRRALERRFHQALGRSPALEIRHVRIELAKRLLATTDLKMPQIARRCGFANAPRFSEAFARATGHTPSAFRRASTRRR